jgi:hypothetical protein
MYRMVLSLGQGLRIFFFIIMSPVDDEIPGIIGEHICQ